jgi:hypothetical protein
MDRVGARGADPRRVPDFGSHDAADDAADLPKMSRSGQIGAGMPASRQTDPDHDGDGSKRP